MPDNLEREIAADMNRDFEAVLGRVSAAVLETMFFEEVVETQCAHDWLASAVSACLNFDGSHCGEFRLSVSSLAAPSIAAGFLGLDPEELTEAQPGQVVLELSNILCGAVMSNLWPESSLSLDPPQLAPSGEVPPGFLHRCFLLPDGTVAVSIRVAEAVEFP